MPARPRRPTGNTNEAMFARWVYDSIVELQAKDAPGVLTSRTTRGVIRRAARLSQPPRGDTASEQEASP